MNKIIGLHFGLILGVAPLSHADSGWEMAKEKAGRKIYLRTNKGEAIKELMVVDKFEATPEELAKIIMDGESHSKWYPGCEIARVVKKSSDSSFQVYYKIKNPWPVKDRDFVIEMNSKLEGEKGGILIEYKEVEGVVPEDKCCIRAKMFRGFWKFSPDINGNTIATYVLSFDPAGTTPASFISWSMPRFGGNIFSALSERVKKLKTNQTR